MARDRRVDVRVLGGGRARRDDRVVVEQPLEVGVQGTSGPRRVLGITLRTPGDDLDLAVGWLVSQGLLRHPDELRGARWCADADRSRVPGPLGSTVAAVLAGSTVAGPTGAASPARPGTSVPVAPGDAGIGDAGIGDAGIGDAGIGDAGIGDAGIGDSSTGATVPGDAITVDVLGPTPSPPGLPRVVHAGCGVCGDDLLDDLAARGAVPTEGAGPSWDADAVLGLTGLLLRRQPTFAATGGLHAALRVRRPVGAPASGRVVHAAEDVGRHNAVDKLVGHGLRSRDADWSGDALVLSGRVGYELVAKAAVAGCPLVVGVGATTGLAIDVAERFGVTLVAFARDGRANVHTHADRIRPERAGAHG